MPRLVWDAIGEKIYETGLSKGVLYLQKGAEFPEGVVWNGLTAVTESPGGAEPTELYADNIKYASLRSAETFGATIEAFTYPDEFDAANGSATIATGVTIGQQSRNPFGFSYVTEIGSDATTDVPAYKIHLVYGATASPSEQAHATINDSPEAVTFSWEITTTPVPVIGNFKPTSKITIDSTEADPVKLKALEDILYGSSTVEARLPLPNEIISLMGGL